jgi:hypothetical protein
MIDYTALGGDHFRMRKRNMHGICSHAIRETVSPSTDGCLSDFDICNRC